MDLDERTTRKLLIDRAIDAAGWSPIVRYRDGAAHQHAAVAEYPTANGPVDYALFDDGEPLALVEAKRLGVGPQNVLKQAQRYARGLTDSPFDFNGYHVPFVYSTNGSKFFFQDLRERNSRSREVAAFHAPSALREMLARDSSSSIHWLRETPNEIASLRPYQRAAIQALEGAMLDGKRKMLVAMATGTGKTFTTISLIYRLMKSGFARRVLFLVDRRALAAQAVAEMNKFDAEPGLKFSQTYEVYHQRFHREDLEEEDFDPRLLPTEYLTNPQPGHAFVYVCTIQRMRINLFGQTSEVSETSEVWDDESDADRLDIPIHAFDVVIADECHRGYTAREESKWREVLEHFDGIRIGLTATPAAHTIAYFKEIVYRYEYERAVREGYLVDYDPVRIQSRIKQKGVFLKPGEEVGLKDRQTGQLRFDFLEDERELPAATNEQDWTAPDTNEQIVKAFAEYARRQEQETGHFPKTLFFACNDLPHTSHADQLVTLLRDEFGQGDAFVQKITGSPSVDRPLQRIREFRNRPETGIAVTVDLLSTGVDIPALENIVLLRPIKSRILFEQILGRGTRKCDQINKTHFTVFDAAGVLEYFQNASAFTDAPPDKPTRKTREIIDDIYNNRDRKYNTRVLVRRLQRMAKNISGQGRGEFKQLTGTEDVAAWARDLPDALDDNWAYTIGILRNPAVRDFLDTYPRERDPFIIAESATDTVTSELEFKTADGRMLKPKDYIAEFERFVRENPERIEAIRILLERPADWNTGVLKELRDKLATRPEQFTEKRLRIAYQHALADIISIVHHAARREPLLTAEERVNQAMKKGFIGSCRDS
jgi:type I restriction enzyme R subunit